MSYQPHVAELLAGVAEVVGPADNCQYSLYTLSSLNRWIVDLRNPDIVHWNNGIHDAGHNPGFLSDDQLHFSETGQKACARAVTDHVSSSPWANPTQSLP